MATPTQQTKTSVETERLLQWFEERAIANGGVMPAFSNADAVTALHGSALSHFARAHGNVQSRLDYACYVCRLPPLGLTADRKFSDAWSQKTRSWTFPVAKMQAAAQTHAWTQADFDRIRSAAGVLPGSATKAWNAELERSEADVIAWAFSFQETGAMPRTPTAAPKFARIDWSRDELILALDLYLRDPMKSWDDRDEAIVSLSALLNRLAPWLGHLGGANYRNANGVAMKLMNFRSLDPRHVAVGKKGLSQGSKADRATWAEFANDRERLSQVAAGIEKMADDPGARWRSKYESADDFITQAEEGGVFTRTHQARERDGKLVRACKRRFLKRHGRFFCEGCGFDFAQRYGTDKGDIIDCHHTNPVHTLQPGHKTSIDDLVLLCANCHRVVHSSSKWLSIAELKTRLGSPTAPS